MNQAKPSVRGSRLALSGLIACLAAIGAVEVTGINSFERTIIHRDFVAYQFAFFSLLWALTTVFLRRKMESRKPSLFAFLFMGLLAGFISAWLTFPAVGLVKGEWSAVRHILSWQGAMDSVVATTIGTLGWLLVGLLSGALSFALIRARNADPVVDATEAKP